MGWNSSTTTVVTTPPTPTANQLEAERLRLEELRRQNQIAAQLLPGQLDLIELQRQQLQYQIDHQGDLSALQNQELELRRLQIEQQIRDAALQEQLRPGQIAYLNNQNALAIEQIAAMRETTGFQREQNVYILEQLRDQQARIAARNAALSPEEEAAGAAEEFRRAQRMGGMSEEFARIQLEAAQRGNKPTDEQLANINESIDSAQALGESDINRYFKESLRTINEETAQAAGLRATDTPVVRLSERAGEEAARAQGDLTSKLAQTRADARLNYPLASNKLQADIAATGQSLSQGAAEFQNNLRFQAAANRTQAFSMPSSIGFATPQTGGTPSLNFMNPAGLNTNPNAFGYQFGNPGGSSQTTFGGASIGNYGQMASGLGGLMSGAASLWDVSDARLKTDVKRVGRLDSGLPVYTYRFKGTATPKIGVLAQETARLFPNAVARHPSGFLMVNHSKVH